MFGVASTAMITTEKTRAGHHKHEHELELQNYTKRFTCNGCKERGFGQRYRCEGCDYDLHIQCMFPKPTICHDFFQGSVFKFFPEPRTSCGKSNCEKHARCCDACGKDICAFNYHCEEKGWDLHPCCSNLENRFSIDGVNFELRNKVSSKCMRCKKKVLSRSSKKIPGWSYVSTCQTYHFHVYCVTEMVHEAWKKGAIDNINSIASLEKMDLPLAVNSNRNRGRGGEFWRTVKIFLKSIVSILLGDTTMILASVLVELIPK